MWSRCIEHNKPLGGALFSCEACVQGLSEASDADSQKIIVTAGVSSHQLYSACVKQQSPVSPGLMPSASPHAHQIARDAAQIWLWKTSYQTPAMTGLDTCLCDQADALYSCSPYLVVPNTTELSSACCPMGVKSPGMVLCVQ